MTEEGGEVSGNKDDFMKKCSPCLKKGTEKGAEKYCYVCKTFFCGNCIVKHNELFSEHRLTNTGSVDIDVIRTSHTEVCQQHGESMVLYFKDDDAIGCEMCMTSKHGEREEEDALEMARQAHLSSEREKEQAQIAEKSQREKDRLREQERRRRQAMSNQIDMNEQIALMAQFEDNIQ